MILFILKVILTVVTLMLDCLIAIIMGSIISLLLWDAKFFEAPPFIHTRMLWKKDMTITEIDK